MRSQLSNALPPSLPSLPCRATVMPSGGTLATATSGLPTLQVVLAEAAALRLPVGTSGHGTASFCRDMIDAVPAARWDWERQAGLAAGARATGLPARFGGFLQGGLVGGWLCRGAGRGAAFQGCSNGGLQCPAGACIVGGTLRCSCCTSHACEHAPAPTDVSPRKRLHLRCRHH